MIGAELAGLVELRSGKIRVPVDTGRLLREVGFRPDVGRLGEVLALFAAGVRARDLEFEVIDALRLRRSVALPRRGEQLFDIGLIFGANRDRKSGVLGKRV